MFPDFRQFVGNLETWLWNRRKLGATLHAVTRIIKTAQTDPNHQIVGQFFKAWSMYHPGQTVYYCDSWVEDMGFWMVNVYDANERRNVSVNAIGRTYHYCREYDKKYAPALEAFAKNVCPILHTFKHLP